MYRISLPLVLFSVLFTPFFFVELAQGQEAERARLYALRGQRKFAEAVAYLDEVEKDMSAPKKFLETIDYERGATLIHLGIDEKSPIAKCEIWERAAKHLSEFCRIYPEHQLYWHAQYQMGYVLAAQASVQFRRSRSHSEPFSERKKALLDARSKYQKALDLYQGYCDKLTEKLKAIPDELDHRNPEHRKLIKLQEQYRNEHFQGQQAKASLKQQLAKTYGEGDARQ